MGKRPLHCAAYGTSWYCVRGPGSMTALYDCHNLTQPAAGGRLGV